MKPLFTLPVLVVLCGCGAKSPYDISPDQVRKHQVLTGGPPDLNHLPPGAKKEVQTFKKGDRLPDGSIATGPVKLVRVRMTGNGRDDEEVSLTRGSSAGGAPVKINAGAEH